MSYKINPHDAMTDLYGVDKGAAQVIDISPTMRRLEQKRNQSYLTAANKEKERNTRGNALNKSVQDLAGIAIHPEHQQAFADEQAKLAKFVNTNIGELRAGDPEATMQYQQMYNNIKTTAELSKNFREQQEKVGLEVAKDPTKYRDESIQYLLGSAKKEDGSLNFELDPSKIRQNVDLINDFRTNVRPIIEDIAKGKSYTYEDAQGNEYTIDKNNFDAKHAEEFLRDRLKNGVIAEQAAYDFGKLSPEEQGKYSDYNDWYVKKMLPLAIVDQDKIVNRKKEDEKAKIEVADSEDSMTFKAEKTVKGLTPAQQTIANMSDEEAKKLTQEQQAKRREYLSGTSKEIVDVPMLAKATHVKSIPAATTITDRMRTISGDKVPTGVDIREAEYGQTGVMPFVKDGKEKGNLIHKSDLKKYQKEGNIEWTVATTGVLKYGEGKKEKKVSIVRPTSEILSPIEKQVDVPALQKIADDKNATYSTEKIMVVAPNGQKGYIPKNQLQAALQKGYKQTK